MITSTLTCITLGTILVALIIPGIADDLAHAQELSPVLFSAIPNDTPIPPSLDARSEYAVGSEMAVANIDALRAETLNATVFGTTYTISKDSVEIRGAGDYTWFGSGEQVMDAILVVEGTRVFGLIYTPTQIFEILHVSSTIHEIYELDMSKFPPVNSARSGAADAVQGAAGAVQDIIDRGLISQLESSYVGWYEYDEDDSNMVTIDVYAAMTDEAVRKYRGSATALAQLAVDTANRAYQQNDLPIRLNVADQRIVRGYADAGTIENDLSNLKDPNNSAFNRVRAEVEQADADVVVMFVKDYEISDDDNNDYKNTCGKADVLLADDKNSAFAVVESICVPAHSFTNVIGHLQGAGYNAEQEANSEFAYGYGYYHAGADKRTIMSQSAENCDDPRTSDEEEECERQGIWSDPHRNFFGTTTPAGTAESWNARAVFSTAPHIASLRGDAQSYDSVKPTGSITLPSAIPSKGTIQILANFSEPLHEWFPPHITITDGVTVTAAVMEKLADVAYVYQHRLDGERGEVDFVFSNARDLFGNAIVKTPTSGASFNANAKNLTQVLPPKGSIFEMSEDFVTLGSSWKATGDGSTTWKARAPVDGVPDQKIATNRVASSDNCDDSCFLTLQDVLDTTKPLAISFDRYVDAKADRDEGLHVEYSVNGGTTWSRLASYTHNNDGDTDRWEKTAVGLSIPQSSAMLRFHAESNQDDEIIEMDNLKIFRPDSAQPDVTFKASLNSALSTITITMSKSNSHAFSTSDFTLSHGTISSVGNTPNSAARSLHVSGIPYDTAVTVTYTGSDLNLGDGAILNNGTAATAPPVSKVTPPPLDTIPPVIVAPADISTEATGPQTTIALGTPLVSDNVDPNPKVTNNAPVSFALGTTTITWTATDASGNRATDTQRVTIRDTAPPTFSGAPSDITVKIASHLDSSTVTFGTPTATDLVDGAITVKTSHASGSQFSVGTTTVTFTASDRSGNTARHSISVMVVRDQTSVDTTPPVIAAPADITAEATGRLTVLPALGTPIVSDNTDSNPKVTNDAPASFALGTTIVTWTATDASGNRATDTQRVTIRDTTSPTVSAPSDITTEATGPSTAVALGTPAVSDNVDSNPKVTNNAPSSSSFALGTTTITWTATDASGNRATDTQRVTVRDTTPPTFTNVPSDITAEVDGTGTYVNYRPPTAYDTVDKERPVTTTPPPGAWFAIGTHTVTFAASDKSDNTATAHMTITIKQTPDTTSPRITAPPDVTVEATGSHTEVRLGTPRVSDNRDHSPTVTNNAPASFPLGTTIITWTAVDDAGNRATDTQRVTIRDTTPPAFANMPADITKYVDLPQAISEDYGVPVEFDAPTATDLVDGPVSVHGSHESGAKFRPGSTTVMWNATDSAGNTATTSITINIYSNIRKETLNLINDRFDNGLDDWAYTEKPYPRYNQIFCGMVAEFHNYNITYSTEHGGSMHLSESDIDACWLGTAGPVKRFTMPPTHRDGAASAYLEYRSLADLSNNTRGLPINTALVMITDANYKVIKHERLYNAAVEDSGWLNKTIQLGPLGKKCPCEIFIYTLDAWWDGPWDHQLYVDNLQVTVSPPPEPDGVSGASAPTGIMYGALYKQDLLEMLSHEGARIIISDVQVSSDAMTIQWEPFASLGSNDKSNGDKTTKYRIVLHPAGNSDEKISILTADTQHRFDGLESDTSYNLRVRVAGDHDTQSTLSVRTDEL